MKLSIILLHLIAFKIANSQVKLSGTYNIAAICNDGIVMGIDSRGVLMKNVDTVYAYFDGIQKQLIIRNCAIGFTGLIVLKDKFISSYIKEFAATVKKDIEPNELIQMFTVFIQTKHPSAMEDYKKLGVIAIGIKGKEKLVCGLDVASNIGTCSVKGGVMASDTLSKFNSIYNAKYCEKRTCPEIASLIKREINAYAVKYKRQNTIGGKIYIIKMSQDGRIDWLGDKPPVQRWVSRSDFIKDYKGSKIQVTFTSKEAREKVNADFKL